MKKLLLVLVLTMAIAVPSTAQAAPKKAAPECGALITEDVRLTADMTCEGMALRVAAGVTVDLRGHTITITGALPCAFPNVSCAIRGPTRSPFEFLDGPSDPPITVKNGTLRGAGIYANAVVDRVKFEQASSVLWGGTVTRSKFTDGGLTMMLPTVVDHNRFIRSGIAADTALFSFTSGFAVTDNRVDSAGLGLLFMFGGGDLVGEVSRNRVKNSPGHGIFIAFEEDAVTDLVVRDNHVRFSGRDGIRIENCCVHVDFPGDHRIVVTGNLAARNGELGIRVIDREPPVVVDGGGNVARRNGDPAQCSGITCTTRRVPQV